MLPTQYLPIFVSVTVAAATFLGSSSTTLGTGNQQQFKAYWNVPTFMCHKYGITFENLKDFGIRQNTGDRFRGDQIVILYDPGMFPALLTDVNGIMRRRNGGVPQEGNLKEHLEMFRKDLYENIPDVLFNGVGVIDFESWRPIFRQNWASLEAYKTLSINLERKKHPLWNDEVVKKEAKRRFEKYAKIFMEETLKLAKTLRPKAAWGYYGYPHCFNQSPGQPNNHCDRQTMTENDEITWLFNLENVHMPSVYLRLEIKEEDRISFVKGRVSEALRIAGKSENKSDVLPYYWFKYQDRRDHLLSKKDTENVINTIANTGADGVIIWGSSEDTDMEQKCDNLQQYVKETLGPAIKRITQL